MARTRVAPESLRYAFCSDCGRALAYEVDGAVQIGEGYDADLLCLRCDADRDGAAEMARIDAEDAMQQALWFVARLHDGADDVLWMRNLRRLAVCGELMSLADRMRAEAG